MTAKTDKAVLYIAGGGISGVFGAGIVTGLQDRGAYSRIKAAYGASAGAFDLAYFLTHQSRLGSTIYWEEMPHGIVEPGLLWRTLIERYRTGRIFPRNPDHYLNMMHMAYVRKVVAEQKKLNVRRLQEQPIPFFVKVFNQHNHRIEYIDIKDGNAIDTLLASAAMPPYTFEFELIHHNRLVDSCIAEVIGLKRLLARHPNDRIVIVVNRRPQRNFTGWLMCELEAAGGSTMYGQAYRRYPFSREVNFARDVKAAQKNSNILLVMPPPGNPTHPSTMDEHKIKKSYRYGLRASQQIWDFIDGKD